MEFIPTTFSNKLSSKDIKKLKNSIHSVNKAIDFIHIDFAKAEQMLFAFYKAFPNLRSIKGTFSSHALIVSWRSSNNRVIRFKPNLTLRRTEFLTKKEIELQKALGTLPYKEYMQLKNIIFENSWWFFPTLENHKFKVHKTITINNQEYYPVADEYIDDLYHSLSHNKYTEEKFADEIISQCYSCMSLETIDH